MLANHNNHFCYMLSIETIINIEILTHYNHSFWLGFHFSISENVSQLSHQYTSP